MTRVFPALAAAAVLVAACAPPRTPTAPDSRLPDRLRVRSAGRIVTVPLEDYVLGTVLAELSPASETPAVVARLFEVQAVIARSYAAARRGRHAHEQFDLCDTTHCQLYEPQRIRTSHHVESARAAIDRTRGQVLVYDRHPAEALFHADCGGGTSDASTVWGGRVPYLRARRDDVQNHVARPWTTALTTAELRDALNRDTRTAVGDHLLAIRAGAPDAGLRPGEMTLAGDRTRLVRAEVLRAVLTSALGARVMPSTRFTVRREGDRWVFVGTGFGHGVGLCQAGARARARAGASLREILAAYFSGAALGRLRDN